MEFLNGLYACEYYDVQMRIKSGNFDYIIISNFSSPRALISWVIYFTNLITVIFTMSVAVQQANEGISFCRIFLVLIHTTHEI